MIEPAVILLRLAQYAGAMVLLGASLFFVYALPKVGPASAAQLVWTRRLLVWSAGVVVVASALGLVAQTAIMAGSLQEGLKPASLGVVAFSTGLGRASLVRVAVGAIALTSLLLARPGRRLWLVSAAMGAIAVGSFPWMGHGAASEGIGGVVHLASDMIHGWAAAIWVGALVVFMILLAGRVRRTGEAERALHAALKGFSGVGSAVVAALVATGLINSWFLVGPNGWAGLVTTAYGRLLALKLGIFALMLALAAVNRFSLSPRLAESFAGDTTSSVLRDLRASAVVETIAAFAVLGLVAWLGTLAPVAAQ